MPCFSFLAAPEQPSEVEMSSVRTLLVRGRYSFRRCALIVSYPDPRHSSGWITSPLRGSRVWRISRQNRGQWRSNLNVPIGLRACAISDFN